MGKVRKIDSYSGNVEYIFSEAPHSKKTAQDCEESFRAVVIMKNEKIISTLTLLTRLKHFREANPKAMQLDGSLKKKSNPKAWALVEFQGEIFRLHSDTSTEAVDRFIFKCRELGAPHLALSKSVSTKGKPSLKLNDGNFKSKGWYCYSIERSESKNIVVTPPAFKKALLRRVS